MSETERDELAALIYGTEPWANGTAYDAKPYEWSELDDDDKTNWHPQADAILAAGYRRPRTVTTVEELKALRLPAIIDSPAGGPARVEYYAGPGLQQRYVEPLFCDDDSDTECYSPEFFASFGLPATVLYEPEPES